MNDNVNNNLNNNNNNTNDSNDNLNDRHTIHIEVAYAKLEQQTLVPLTLKVGSTVHQAIQQSGVLALLSDREIETLEDRLGIFGEKVSLSTELKEGQRVEIYRDLKQDPKEARRARARKKPASIPNSSRDRS